MRYLPLLLLFYTCKNTYSQEVKFDFNYLGEDYLLYKGVLLKLQDNPLGLGYMFYNSLDGAAPYYNNAVIYPESQFHFNTNKDSLKNKVFIVQDIVTGSGSTINNGDLIEKPIFILKDTMTNQIIYFKYDKEYEHNFPFITSKISYDEKILCSKIEKQIDDFTGEVKYNTPLFNGNSLASVIVYKYKSKTKTSYYLSLHADGSTVNVNETGVIILFSDGTKWSRAIKISVDAGGSGFEYSAFIPLTPTDLITFNTKRIKKFRLYIYDNEINSAEGEKIKHYIKCLKSL